jgi:secondary thiamine-phosphate synthase enzyme
MHTQTLDVRTHNRDEMIDLTHRVAEVVAASGVAEGLVAVYVPHTTAGVTINENADPAVVHDILAGLNEAVPWRQPFYRHTEGNAAAHIKSSLVGCRTTIPVTGGRMTLGTWQAVFFCEFDGPRTRRAVVTVVGDRT